MKIVIRNNDGQPITFGVAPVLAVLFLGLFACVTYGAFQLAQPDLFKTLAQGLLNILIAIAAFYWGSSQGSQKKDDTIAALKSSNGDNPP